MIRKQVITIATASLTAFSVALSAAPAPILAAENKLVLTPTEDYSHYALPAVDQDGWLHLTDNHTVEQLPTTHLTLRNVRFTIPAVWQEHVVIRAQYLNQVKSEELYKTQVQDSYVLRFYEKTQWQTHETARASIKNQTAAGELAELRIMNRTLNDLSKWEQNARSIHFATITDENGTVYEAYLTRSNGMERVTDAERLSRWGYLSDIDYQGCIISSFTCGEKEELTYPVSYIRHRFVEGFNPEGEGMTNGSTIPADYVPITLEAAKNNSDTMPAELNLLKNGSNAPLYQWKSFYSPWIYDDRGQNYRNLLVPTPSITMTPTPTETPEITSGPESVTEIPLTKAPEPEPDTPEPTPEPTNPQSSEEEPADPEEFEGGGE